MNFKIYFTVFCFFLVSSSMLVAQKSYDLGVYLGGVNYYGEVGKKVFLAPNRPLIGVIGKMNLNEKFSVRGGISYFTLSDDDRDAGDTFRGTGRNKDLYYSFENKNLEVALGFEYVVFALFKETRNPMEIYGYGGLGAVYSDEMYYPISAGMEDVEAIKYGSRTRMVIPFGVGLKMPVGSNFTLGLELTPRYSFSDNFDGSHPDNESLEANRLPNHGDTDWYTSIGLTLTYRFGKGSNTYCDCGL